MLARTHKEGDVETEIVLKIDVFIKICMIILGVIGTLAGLIGALAAFMFRQLLKDVREITLRFQNTDDKLFDDVKSISIELGKLNTQVKTIMDTNREAIADEVRNQLKEKGIV